MNGFWKGKKVFVTGHTGFKGGWIVVWLKMMGAEVYGYSLEPPSGNNLFTVANIGEGIESVFADIRDKAFLASAMHEFRPEIVIHLAAQPLVRQSYIDPVETYETNVLGTVNLLDAIRRSDSVKSGLIITSDKCYENKEWHWGYRENDRLGGHDPYSSSKGCTELVTSAYRRSFFEGDKPVNIATARAGNVIGGGDWAKDRLVPDLLEGFAAGKKVNIRNPASVRPWQHVLDPLSGYLMLLEKMSADTGLAGAWNFGPDETGSKPVSWLADTLASMWRNKAEWVCDKRDQPHEAGMLKLDCSQTRARLGWRGQLDITEALRLTVSWVESYSEGHDMRYVTEQQIKGYMSIV